MKFVNDLLVMEEECFWEEAIRMFVLINLSFEGTTEKEFTAFLKKLKDKIEELEEKSIHRERFKKIIECLR